MSTTDDEKVLTEKDCLVASQQYDPKHTYHVSLPRKGFQRLHANAFLQCGLLQVLDISGNRLTSLDGLQTVAPQLTYLNAAENQLQDISVLASCAMLERCFLQGNELSSVAALKPLVLLYGLIELVLQRRVSMDGLPLELAGTSEGGGETLLLDNPVCRTAEVYTQQFVAYLQHVRWVDGVSSFRRAKLLSAGSEKNATEGAQNATAKDIIDRAMHTIKDLSTQMTTNIPEENSLRRQLEAAQHRCAQIHDSTATT